MQDHVRQVLRERQLRRGVMQLLASNMTGEARAEFLDSSERALNRDCPLPSKGAMRLVMK